MTFSAMRAIRLANVSKGNKSMLKKLNVYYNGWGEFRVHWSPQQQSQVDH